MYRVILIDDERWALESLKRIFPWERCGFQIVGSYTDALEGWEAVCRLKPDVAFLDNCMPEKRGLDIVAEAKRLLPPPLFVIVSGYSDFPYVKEALQLNVFDYCLKPVSREDAANLLGRLKAALEERKRRGNAEILERIQNGMAAQTLFELNGLPCEGGMWRVAVLRYANEGDVDGLRRALFGENVYLSWLGSTKMMAVLNGTAQACAAMEERIALLAPRKRLMIGLSQAHASGSQFWQCISEARSCAYCDFINPEERMVAWHKRESERADRHAAGIIDAIAAKDSPRAKALIRQMPELFRAEGVQMHNLCRYWILWMNAFKQNGGDALSLKLEWVSEPEDMYMMLNEGIKGLADELDSYLELYLDGAGERDIASQGQNFAEIVEYVNEHYRERLRLDALASRFHLNMAYCSEVFKKTAGMTFTDYMTKLRMEYAHQKICEGGCDLQSLALEIGYGDYFTFSKRFKKYYGVSPSRVNR